jgi:hypothetical protein
MAERPDTVRITILLPAFSRSFLVSLEHYGLIRRHIPQPKPKAYRYVDLATAIEETRRAWDAKERRLDRCQTEKEILAEVGDLLMELTRWV